MGLTANTGPYNAAAEYFGVDDPMMTKIPRNKFNFDVNISINPNVPLIDSTYGRQFTFHRVEGVSLPDYSQNIMPVNQYNRIRYVTTRQEPTPAQIVFYDTKDNQFQYLMQSYTRHYGTGQNLDQRTMMTYDTITPGFDGSFGTKAVPTDQRFFIDTIAITSRDTANTFRSITMYNCMITNVSHDRLSYADSNPVTWTVTIQPEHVNFDTEGSSNGAITSGLNSPTVAYDPTRSAAAGFLVNAAGELIKDSMGNNIPLSNVANFVDQATNTLNSVVGTSSNSGFDLRLDSNGNRVTASAGPISLSANLPPAVSNITSGVSRFTNVIRNIFG